MLTPVGLTPPVPLDDDPFASEPTYDHPESVEALRVRFRRLADRLWEAMFATDGARDHDAYMIACRAWCEAHAWATALDWLLLGEVPILYTGRASSPWVESWFAGPWPAELQP